MTKPTYEGINYLDQCAGILKEFGSETGSISAESPYNNTKRRNIGCLLSDITENGFPYYFTEFGWGYDSNEEQTVEFIIEDNQTAKLYSSLFDVAEWMGDSQEFNLDHPEFLHDYLHFMRNVKESELELNNKRTFSANEVFEGLFIGFDLHNSETITLFSDEYLTACGAEASAFIHAILDNDIDTLVDKGWRWCDFAGEARKSNAIAKKSKKMSENDIGFLGAGACINFKSSTRYMVVEDDVGNVVECDIVLFLRVRNTFSTWWAWNYLQNTLEGEALLSKLLSADGMRSWKTILRNTNIFGPTTRITQIKEMLELSFLRKHFDDQMSRILYRRSPVSAQKELILRQVDLANKALVTHMGDIERFVSPLPAFFEHPLHSFRVSSVSEPHKAAVSAQFLLNSLCKIPLFVILEEQLYYPDDIDEELSLIAEELQAKPVSDGALLGWQKKLLESCPKRGWYFASRMRKIFTPAILEDLGKCVARRNQYHHPPYDLPSFLEAMTWFLDKHETTLRRAFEQLCFIKVKELNYSADGFRFKCHVLEGATRTFPMNEVKTSLAPEKLNSDYVVLYDKISDKSLPFKTYLETKEQAHKSLNIGLYNRPTSHGIEYDYVFSE